MTGKRKSTSTVHCSRAECGAEILSALRRELEQEFDVCIEWQAADGRTLKRIQDAEVGA